MLLLIKIILQGAVSWNRTVFWSLESATDLSIIVNNLWDGAVTKLCPFLAMLENYASVVELNVFWSWMLQSVDVDGLWHIYCGRIQQDIETTNNQWTVSVRTDDEIMQKDRSLEVRIKLYCYNWTVLQWNSGWAGSNPSYKKYVLLWKCLNQWCRTFFDEGSQNRLKTRCGPQVYNLWAKNVRW